MSSISSFTSQLDSNCNNHYLKHNQEYKEYFNTELHHIILIGILRVTLTVYTTQQSDNWNYQKHFIQGFNINMHVCFYSCLIRFYMVQKHNIITESHQDEYKKESIQIKEKQNKGRKIKIKTQRSIRYNHRLTSGWLRKESSKEKQDNGKQIQI